MVMKLLPVLFSELRREYLLWRAYRLNALSTVAMWGIIFPIILIGLEKVAADHGVPFGDGALGASIIGFLVWRLCMSVLVAMPSMIEQESQVGVVESLVLAAGTSMAAVLACRSVARSIRAVLEVALLAVVLVVLFRVRLPLSATAVLIILLTLAGTCGVAFSLAGAALVYKSVSSLTGIVAILALFISGAAVPLNALGPVFTILKLAFPTTWGIDLLRGVMLSGDDLNSLVTSGALPGLALQSTLLVLLGLGLFSIAFRRARQNGMLGTY
jgi:ABC-2 type transport system permease protein